MNDSVLLFIDQKRRDTLPVMLIYYYLISQGVEVHLSSVVDFFMKYVYYKPKVVLQANPDIYHGDWSRFIAHHSLIACLPTEQQITHPESAVARVLEGHNGKSEFKDPYIEGVYRFYLWGQFLADLLCDSELASNKRIEAKIQVTGCPRLVNYGYYLQDHPSENEREKFTVGIALEDDFNHTNLSHFLYLLRDFNFYEFGGSVENYCCTFVYINSILLKIMDTLPQKEDIDIVVRPRLGDSQNNYDFIRSKYKNMRFDTEDAPHNFFRNIDCLVLAQSSVGTEAQIAGIPVISVYGLLDEQFSFLDVNKDGERLKYYWKPKSFDELEHLIELARKKELPVTPDAEGFEQFVESVYLGSLREEHPSKIIAKDIKNALDNFESIKAVQYAGLESEGQIDYFRGLLPRRFKNKAISRILYNNIMKDSLVWRVLAAPIFCSYKAGLFLYDKLGKVDTNSCFLDFEKSLFKKYETVYEEINELFEQLGTTRTTGR